MADVGVHPCGPAFHFFALAACVLTLLLRSMYAKAMYVESNQGSYSGHAIMLPEWLVPNWLLCMVHVLICVHTY